MSLRDFEMNHGLVLLSHYQRSYSLTLRSVYSEHTFLPWLFRKSPKGFFQKKENVKEYVEWLAKKVGVPIEELTYQHFLDNHGYVFPPTLTLIQS